MTAGGCTHGLSSPVGEVLPKQQAQLSGDSHIDVFPTSLRTLQLLAVEPNRKICRSATEITNVSPTGKINIVHYKQSCATINEYGIKDKDPT